MPSRDAEGVSMLFAYGTLLDPGIQDRVIGRCIQGRPDVLEGYRLASVEDGGETFPNCVPATGERVPGRILELTRDELARADGYEGDLYTRERLTLGSGVSAWVYIAP
ncbi:MAG: gamma-glutamylcyclotransferase [Candidatus Hydrogenedentes bacterium]|nr:gamma-glutamylcyclotransferase [Candidatus Hydrogenedentota bacterium]